MGWAAGSANLLFMTPRLFPDLCAVTAGSGHDGPRAASRNMGGLAARTNTVTTSRAYLSDIMTVTNF